jgi:hypothetical protein
MPSLFPQTLYIDQQTMKPLLADLHQASPFDSLLTGMDMKYFAALALTLALSNAGAAQLNGGAGDLGQAVTNSQVNRTVTIDSNTKYVNVSNGETVNFDINGQVFAWHVSTYPGVHEFNLKQIAPDLPGADHVRVFVAPDPLYTNP